MANQITNRLKEKYGIKIPIASLFENSTIKGMASEIDKYRVIDEKQDVKQVALTDREVWEI